MATLDFLFDFIFVGIALIVLIVILLQVSLNSFKDTSLFEEVLGLASLILRIAGLLYLVYFVAMVTYDHLRGDDMLPTLDMMIGPFWFYFWTYPIVLGMLPQLLWIKRYRNRKWILASLAVLTFFASFKDLLSEGIAKMVI